jgi:CMP-N,N'-diacetyllegionaminic acid synthase
MKRILIIGNGSIAQKHEWILKKYFKDNKIFIYTKHNNHKKKNIIKNLNNLNKYKLDYVIICSKTSEHITHLELIDKQLKNKLILIEKPLFEKSYNYSSKRNKIYVGYNLRFHPIIKFVKNFIKNKKIFFVKVSCASFLPNWRKNIKYQNSYSAKKKFGGGVLLDLSHEIDYINWIFGKIKKIRYSYSGKISNLKIDSDDHLLLNGVAGKIDFSLNLNYYSRLNERLIYIYGNTFSIKADLIKNIIEIFEKKKKIIKYKLNKKFTYIQQHKSILRNKFTNCCSFNEGKIVLNIIDKIKELKNKKL